MGRFGNIWQKGKMKRETTEGMQIMEKNASQLRNLESKFKFPIFFEPVINYSVGLELAVREKVKCMSLVALPRCSE